MLAHPRWFIHKEFIINIILASKSKKSIFLIMSRKSSMWIFQLSNTATMDLSIPVSIHHTHLERIPICETFLSNVSYTSLIIVYRLKWKPPSENSIDFKLVLRFPPSRHDPTRPDFHAKPLFLLHVWCGGEGANAKYEDYDDMYVENEEWEE